MSFNNLISVIIVNFNAGHLLTECITAVLATYGVMIEIFVIDNASEDNSLNYLEKTIQADERVHIIKNQENVGFARAANQALTMTQGEFLLFLNPDCLIQPDTLQRLQNTVKRYPSVGMAGCIVHNPDGSEQSSCRRSIPYPGRALVQILHLHRWFPQHAHSLVLSGQPLPTEPVEVEGISGACMFVRRAALAEVGAMDETYFLHCEDLDWFMRFQASRWRILLIPDVVVVHAQGTCSRHQPLRVLWYKHRSMIRFYRKFFQSQYPRVLLWAVVMGVWTRFVLLAPITWIKHGLSSISNNQLVSRVG